jgi:hypothetical protein
MNMRYLTGLVLFIVMGIVLTGCNLPFGPTPTPLFPPTPDTPDVALTPELAMPTDEPSPTPVDVEAIQTQTAATVVAEATQTAQALPPTPILPTPTQPVTGPVILPGSPSGPYAVILVSSGDALNIRSGPGVANPVVSSFTPTAVNVMRTGPSARVGNSLWVEVQRPGGGVGWVNSHFLTEYVAPDAFCADARVTNLLTDLGAALISSNGQALAALGSPTHGVDVRLWRHEANINFDREHLRWIFTSTYSHNWGAAPGSGFPVSGSFKDVVLPRLLEVFSSSYEKTCNDVGIAAAFSIEPWPFEYSNIGYFQVLKPATPDIEMDWRIWLVGVEYVGGQPYIFTLIHYEWEP